MSTWSPAGQKTRHQPPTWICGMSQNGGKEGTKCNNRNQKYEKYFPSGLLWNNKIILNFLN
jgi:hypothetical protein